MSKYSEQLTAFLLGLMVLPGCSGVRHSGKPYVLVDNPYPIEVSVNLKGGEAASGTVHYRQGGDQD